MTDDHLHQRGFDVKNIVGHLIRLHIHISSGAHQIRGHTFGTCQYHPTESKQTLTSERIGPGILSKAVTGVFVI